MWITLVHLAAVKNIGENDSSMADPDGKTSVERKTCLKPRACGDAKLFSPQLQDVYGMSPDIPFREDGDLLLGPSMIKRWSYGGFKNCTV